MAVSPDARPNNQTASGREEHEQRLQEIHREEGRDLHVRGQLLPRPLREVRCQEGPARLQRQRRRGRTDHRVRGQRDQQGRRGQGALRGQAQVPRLRHPRSRQGLPQQALRLRGVHLPPAVRVAPRRGAAGGVQVLPGRAEEAAQHLRQGRRHGGGRQGHHELHHQVHPHPGVLRQEGA